MYKLTLALLLTLGAFSGKAQNDLEFVTNKIITNYPGYRFKWKYSADSFRNWAGLVLKENSNDTFKALSLIVHSFHDQHLSFYLPGRLVPAEDTNACLRRLNEINAYLKGPAIKNPREGYWINNYRNCVVGIRLVKSKPETYEAVVIENNNQMLHPGVILGKMLQEKPGEYRTDYRGLFSGARYFLTTLFRNDTVFTTGAEGKWRKLNNYSRPVLSETWAGFEKASGRLLDSNNYLIRLPFCSINDGRIIDSLQQADSILLGKTKNLIIDIRGNMGGRSKAFLPLLRWIQTNPIARTHRDIYPTEDLIADYLHDVEEEQKLVTYDSSDSASVREYVATMRAHLGGSFPMERDTFIFSDIPRPRNVAVIMDYGCQSAAELLVLTFKQSTNVTFFGEHTMGAVDYLDYFPLKTPSGKYRIAIASARRTFKPGEEIDGKGIYPDVLISDNEKDWVGFVRRYYEEKERGEVVQ